MVVLSYERHFGTEGFKAGLEELGDLEGEITFTNRRVGAERQAPFFHDGPSAADVARIQGDVETGQGVAGWGGWQVVGGVPMVRDREGVLRSAESEVVELIGCRQSSVDAGFVVIDLDKIAPGFAGGEYRGQERFEVVAMDRVLEGLEV